jgi:hypothetical protein
MMQQGLYEQLITKLISSKLESISKEQFFIKETIIENNEAVKQRLSYIRRNRKSILLFVRKKMMMNLEIPLFTYSSAWLIIMTIMGQNG